MILYKIKFQDSSIGEIPLSFVSGFSFTVRLTSQYAVSKIILKDASKDLFNTLKIGQKLEIIFYQSDKPDAQKVLYTNLMTILNFKKSPSSQNSVVDTITLDLISSWYYISQVQSGYYFGSVSTIIGNVLSKDIKDLGYTLDISESSDSPKSRYQVQERPQAFCTRILSKGTLDDKPLYLYTDHKNCIRLKGYSEFAKNEAFYFASVMGAEDLINTSAAKKALGTFSILDYDVQVQPSAGAIQGIHTIATYHSSESFYSDSTIMSLEAVSLADDAQKNIQVEELSPTKIEITPWYEDPQDARHSFFAKHWSEITQEFKILLRVPEFELESCALGNLIRVQLPFKEVQNPTTGEYLNFAEGGYIIDSLSYLWDGLNRYTTLEAFQIRF